MNKLVVKLSSGQAALVVANGQSQERAHHATAISDVSVKQESWVGDLHLLVVRVDVVHQGIHRLGEVISGAHVHVGSCGGLRGEVGSSRQVVVSSLGLHDVGNQHVLAVPAKRTVASKQKKSMSLSEQEAKHRPRQGYATCIENQSVSSNPNSHDHINM